MQCEQLQHRLDNLLDDRRDIHSDAEIAGHVAECRACARLVGAYEAMLLGIDLIGEPEPEEEFVRRTVRTADLQTRRARVARRIFATAALAAAILVAALPGWRLIRPADSDAARRTIATMRSSDPNPLAVPRHADGSPEAVARMLHATGRNLAALPETVKRVAAHPKTDQIVGSMRPLAEPVEATWEVLLRAWPAASARASIIPESDTGYIALQLTQHV